MTTRRDFLRTTAGASLLGATAPATSTAAELTDYSLDEWFSNTSNATEVVDKTDQSEVRITVGAEANGGAYGFSPAAVQVDPGTTVIWEWSGDGGGHDVVAENGAFESEMTSDAGHTFEYTPTESGVIRYACTPHKGMGMKGALIVGDETPAGGAGEAGEVSNDDGIGIDIIAIAVAGVAAFLSPIAFGAFLSRKQPRAGRSYGPQDTRDK